MTDRFVGRIPHVPALDGVRGAAVAAVLVFHGRHLTGGWLGVDLFFVLSGYLITALLLQGWRSEGAPPLRNFWSRRARRLGPGIVVLLVAVSIWVVVEGVSAAEQLNVRREGLATLFEVANWWQIVDGGDYWTATLRPSPLEHTWSLSIEEQLYLLWPLVVAGVLAWKGHAKAVLVVALGGAAASVATLVGLHALGASTSRLYFGTDTRASSVLFGAALAAGRVVLGPERWAASRRFRHGLGIGAALVLAVLWATLDGEASAVYWGLLPLAGVAGTAVVASVADRHHPGPLGAALAVAPLVWLGRISYGAYLYHPLIYLVIGEARTGLSGWALLAVRIAVTIAAAAVSYRFLEEPIRSGRWLQGRPARAAVPAGAALCILALFAATLGARQDEGLQEVAARVDRAADPEAPVVLVAGDSVPLLLGVELSRQRDDLGVSVLNRAAPGCHLLADLGPIRGTEGDVRTDVSACAAGGSYRADVEAFDPDVSVVLFGEFPNQAVEIDGEWTMPCDPTYLDATERELASLVDDLASEGAPVVLVTAPGTSLSWVLERVPDGMDERVACTNELLEEIAAGRDGVSVVDLASFVCPPGEECRSRIDGVDLREDGLHFQGEGAALINEWLVPQVLEASGR